MKTTFILNLFEITLPVLTAHMNLKQCPHANKTVHRAGSFFFNVRISYFFKFWILGFQI